MSMSRFVVAALLAGSLAGAASAQAPATVKDGFSLAVTGDLIGPEHPITGYGDPGTLRIQTLLSGADAAFGNQEGGLRPRQVPELAGGPERRRHADQRRGRGLRPEGHGLQDHVDGQQPRHRLRRGGHAGDPAGAGRRRRGPRRHGRQPDGGAQARLRDHARGQGGAGVVRRHLYGHLRGRRRQSGAGLPRPAGPGPAALARTAAGDGGPDADVAPDRRPLADARRGQEPRGVHRRQDRRGTDHRPHDLPCRGPAGPELRRQRRRSRRRPGQHQGSPSKADLVVFSIHAHETASSDPEDVRRPTT